MTKPRPKLGTYLAELRQDAGLSQAELGRIVGETQQNIAFWEQSDKPPRSDVLPKMAHALGAHVEELISGKATKEKKGGPVGKVKKIFEEVSSLPRNQQAKVVEFVSMFLNQYKAEQ